MSKSKNVLLFTIFMFVFAMLLPLQTFADDDGQKVIQTVQKASPGCTLVCVTGSFVTEAEAALKRINEIRYEAYKEGVPNPDNPNQKLDADNYKPLKWSGDLEEIARIRAAESSFYTDHIRPNGSMYFSVLSSNEYNSQGEALAWNYSYSMIPGIEEWYEEKSAWVKQNSNEETRDYTNLINPKNEYVGLGCFISDFSYWENTTCAEFSDSRNKMKETMAQPIKSCKVVLDVYKSLISPAPFLLAYCETTDSFQKMQPGDLLQCHYAYDSTYSYVLDNTTITWSSSDPKVAVVEQPGKIRIVGPGTTVVSGTNEAGVAVKQEIQVLTAAPGLTKVQNVKTGVKFTWKEVAGISVYNVYRKLKNGSWEKIGTASTSSYTDTTAVSGKDYFYTVACASEDGKQEYSAYNTTGLSIRFLAQPTVKTENDATGVKVSWKKISGASGYIVYRKTTGSWVKLATVKPGATISYIDTTASNGTKYAYTAKAYYGKTYSAYNTTGTSIVRLDKITISSLKNNGAGKLTVKWKKNAKATGYQVRYSTDGSFTEDVKTYTITKNSTVSKAISSLKKNTIYYVSVRSYKTVSGKKYYSGWTSGSQIVKK